MHENMEHLKMEKKGQDELSYEGQKLVSGLLSHALKSSLIIFTTQREWARKRST